MTQYKYYFLVGFVCLCLGASLSLFKKQDVFIKEKSKEEVHSVSDESIKKNVSKKKTEVIRPDGTIERTEEEVDLSQSDKHNKTDSLKESSKEELRISSVNKHRVELFLQSKSDRLTPMPNFSYTYQPGALFLRGGVEYDYLKQSPSFSGQIGFKLEF